jgi:2-polyprenyl-3-methyl-5-hydroxy-6-metoxy-1,4-benzoquinol methylase
MSAITLCDEGCPVCGSAASTAEGVPGKIDLKFSRFASDITQVRVARCSQCSALYASPMVHFSPKLLGELYNSNYFSSDLKNMAEKHNILKIVEGRLGPLKGKKLLDIGSGTGEYLQAASEAGMAVTGIDVDESLTGHLRKKHGFEMVTGLFDADTFPRGSFDVIVLSHVIEHLQRPAELLAAVRVALKPGGVFVMCTPNADSFMEAIHNVYGKLRSGFGKDFSITPFSTPYHIVGFNLKSARAILDRAGFRPIYCKLHSGLEWEDTSRRLAMRLIKVVGALLGRGMSIVTVSENPGRGESEP